MITSRQKKLLKRGRAIVWNSPKWMSLFSKLFFPLKRHVLHTFKNRIEGSIHKKTSLEVFCKTINTEDSIICSFPTLLLLLQSTWALSWLKHIYLLKLISWCSHQNSALKFTRKNVKFGMTLIHKTHIFMWNLFTFVITSIMNLE